MPIAVMTGPSPATPDGSVSTQPAAAPPAHRWFDAWTPLVDLDLDLEELREMALAELPVTRGSVRDALVRPLRSHGDNPPSAPYQGPERPRTPGRGA